MTTSEAGALLGNGIKEPEDAEAGKVLSKASKKPAGKGKKARK